MANIKLWYIDKDGNQLGEGESYSVVPGSVTIAPSTDSDIWDGEKWVTPPPIDIGPPDVDAIPVTEI